MLETLDNLEIFSSTSCTHLCVHSLYTTNQGIQTLAVQYQSSGQADDVLEYSDSQPAHT